MNIPQLIIKSSARILKKIQYYGVANIKNILTITIIEDVLSFFKGDTTTDASDKVKYLKNLQHKFIHSDENIIKIQTTTNRLKDYRIPPIYDLEVSVTYLQDDLNIRIPSIKVFIAEKLTTGYKDIGYTTTDDRGLCIFRNINFGSEYVLWLENTDDYKYSESLSSVGKNVSREKKVKLNIGTVKDDTQTKEYSFTFTITDNLGLTVPFTKIFYIDSKGNFNSGYADQNGELAVTDCPAGPIMYYINTPSGYVDYPTIAYSLVDGTSDNITITLTRV